MTFIRGKAAGRLATLLGLAVLVARAGTALADCDGDVEATITAPLCNGGVKPGAAFNVSLAIRTGALQGAFGVTIRRLRFELDCDRDGGLTFPCTDDGAIVDYIPGTEVTTCFGAGQGVAVFFARPTPNQLVVNFSPPAILAPLDSCFVGFDARVISPHSNDSTPNVVEQVAAVTLAGSDAACDPTGLPFRAESTNSFPIVPSGLVFDDGPALDPPPNRPAFGTAVATVGSDLLVGAPAEVGGGAAFLFDGTTQYSSVRLTLENEGGPSARFGAAVAATADRLAVGAPGEGASGRAYVFDASTGERIATLVDPAPDPGAHEFGAAVAFVGPNALVGAPGKGGHPGAAHLYGPDGTLLWSASDPMPGFGTAVAGVGTNALVGAPDPAGGTARLLDGVSGVPIRLLTSASPTARFGSAVAAFGDDALVGDPGGQGAAFRFDITTGAVVTTFSALGASGLGESIATVENRILIGAVDRVYHFTGTGTPLFVFSDESSGAAPDSFGNAVAGAGQLVFVGAPLNDDGKGAAFIFDSVGDLVQALESARPGPLFGTSLAAVGDPAAPTLLAVGAPDDRRGAGSVYLFDAAAGTPLPPPLGVSGDGVVTRFGAALAAAGNRLLVGASNDQSGGVDGGRAYLFVGPAPGGAPAVALQKPTPAAGDGFGRAVALVDSLAAIGAPFDDTSGDDAGAVYLFDAVTGAFVRSLDPPAPLEGAYFGTAVAAAAGGIVVGAPFDEPAEDVPGDGVTAARGGAAFLFDRETGAVRATFRPPPGIDDSLFGSAVAGVGADTVVVGAPLADVLDATGRVVVDAGIVYVFAADGTLRRALTSPHPQPGDQFGFAVGVLGTNILVGAPLVEPGPALLDTGKAYLFDGSSGELLWTFVNLDSRDQFGAAMTAVGANVLVGAARGPARLFAGRDLGPATCELAPVGTTSVAAAPGSGTVVGTAADVADGREPACRGGYCDDRDDCTDDICAVGGCVHPRIPGCGRCQDSADCTDTRSCNGRERCQLCSGCFLHDWPCCGTSSRCLKGRQLACADDATCGSDGACAGGVCQCLCDCNDGDPCTTDGCDASGECQPLPRTGFDAMICVFDRAFPPGACARDHVPAAIGKLFARARAVAAKAAAKPRRRERRLRKIARLLDKTLVRTTRARRKVSTPCFRALVDDLIDAQERVRARMAP